MTHREPSTSWSTATSSPEATRALGQTLGKALSGGLVIGLVGRLGAGKTQFVKGVAVGNGLDDDRQVTSPTFTLIQEYPGRLALYHVDVYRLRSAAEVAALGIAELQRPDSVVLVEWADRVPETLPQDTLWITLEATGDRSRIIMFQSSPDGGAVCMAAVAAFRRKLTGQ